MYSSKESDKRGGTLYRLEKIPYLKKKLKGNDYDE